ncbi:MAG TPA: HEXXH motif-containing putative peptide modification protein [Dongiaceae bacterium]|nr:HEXXH motif-containing putative peptide modification protein [Dongiaceae bacterium]
MIADFRFPPDPGHAARCDRAMHAGLADSLRQICQASAGKVAFDRGAIDRVIAAIESGHRLPPNAFALYYELVPALLDGRLDEASVLLAELGRQRPIGAPFRMLALGEPALADRAERYLRLMNDDTDYRFEFLPPSAEDIAAFKRQFADVMDLLARAAPEFLAELKALISELILVVGPKDAKVHFDGGSSYQLWGALFLNAVRHATRIDVIDSLAHESAHSRLFGLCTEESPVSNPDDELHASPLRREKRPMDGVYHATFVSARMHWAMSRLIASGLLTPDELALAVEARDDDRRNFERGYDTVAAHARLTNTGRVALDAAVAYMRSAA